MIPSTLETFQKLDSRIRSLGDMKHVFAGIMFSGKSDKEKLEFAFKQLMEAEKLIKSMYDDLAVGHSKLYSNPNQQEGCGA